MKKIVFLVCFLISSSVYSATYLPRPLGWVNISFATSTIAVINITTAPTIGYALWCYDCAANGGAGTLCISTGATSINQFILSTGTICK